MHFVEAKGILTGSNGVKGINPYRGCTHGCIYCDSRSKCYQMKHAFEDIEVKRNTSELLERALRSMRKPCMIGTGAMCDPYLHCEEALGLTRACLEVIDRYECGVSVLTKSDRVLRDLDLFRRINERAKAVVQMTLTTWDEKLCRILEPQVSGTGRRLEVLETMRENGIPTVVWLCPILPFIQDTEENVSRILRACAEVGVKGIVCFDMGMTLREGDREYYYAALDRHFPGMKERYIRTYGNAYVLSSPNQEVLTKLFHGFCEERGILHTPEDCFRYLREMPERYEQLRLF